MSNLLRKSVEPIALAAGVPTRTLPEFLSQHCWDEDAVRNRLQQIVAAEHDGQRTIGIIAETSDVTKRETHAGRPASMVYLAFAKDDFHCLLDGELFLPESWWLNARASAKPLEHTANTIQYTQQRNAQARKSQIKRTRKKHRQKGIELTELLRCQWDST